MLLGRDQEPFAAIIPKALVGKEPVFQSKLAASSVQDYEQNITRFIVVQKTPENYLPDVTLNKTSMFIEFREDRHSMLFELLREFHVFGINLCRLESRPLKNTPWRYRFFIDLINNHRVASCLEELQKQDIGYKIFGSFNSITG